MGCFTDHVKLTRVMVQNLDEAVKEVKLLGEHGEESSRKITELGALCQRMRDDTQRLEEVKATLEEMVESHDELLMEIARETELDRVDEGEEGEEEETDNEGDVTTPPATAPPPPAPPAIIPEEIHEEGPMETIPEQEDLKPHEVATTEVESETPQHHLYHALMRDYEEDPLRLEDDFDDLDDYLDGDRSNVEE
jgi:hypothetical protein